MTPNPGWPYAEILKLMNTEPKMKNEDLAAGIVDAYIEAYVDEAINCGTSTDLAALKVERSTGVARTVKELTKALGGHLKNPTVKNALILAHWEAQSYNGELFVDLADFCDLLIDRLASGATDKELPEEITNIRKACGNVKNAIKEMVIKSCFCGIDYQYSNGVSIYFPWSLIFSDYKSLAFAEEHGANWFNFLHQYIEETRRPPRGARAGEREANDSDLELHQKFILFDSDLLTRRVQPLDHGPTALAQSMRNPPRRLANHTIRDCDALKKITEDKAP